MTNILPDKFGIIGNLITLNNSNMETVFYQYIENTLEDTEKKNLSIILPSYIHQILWFNKIDISIDKINSIINANLLENRNKLRLNIKKNILTINNINIFLVNFINKINYINILLNNNLIINNSYQNLGLLIISDSIILQFIEELILKFKKNIINDIKKFILIISDINIEYNTKIINIIKNILKNNVKLLINLNLTNLTNIYNLDEKIKYYYKVIKYYDFIDFSDFIYTDIINHIENIIDNTSNIKDIEFIFINFFFKIKPILLKSLNYEYIINNILNKLINRINEKTFTKLFDIIVKYIINNNNNESNDNTIHNFNDIIKYISLLINGNNIYIEEYINYIDEFIKNNYNNDKLNPSIVIVYATFINNKIKFYEYYYKKLLIRLMNIYKNNDKDHYYIIELQILKQFEKIDKEFVYKFKNIITDVILSHEIAREMKDNTVSHEMNVSDEINVSDEMNVSHQWINDYISPSWTEYNISPQLVEDNISPELIDDNILPPWIEDNILSPLIDDNILPELVEDNMLSEFKKYNILIISYVWKLNYITIINYEGLLSNYLKKYEVKYLKNMKNKIISWLPHYGKIIITYLNIDIVMLPIQFMILELFDKNNSIKIEDILNLSLISNYDDKLKNDIINSLINSKIILNNNSYLILNEKPNFKTNLIEIFFDISNYNYINLAESNKDSLQYTHNEIIETNINSILKLEDLDYEELFNILIKKITIFTITEELLNETLKKMITKDLIEKNDKKYKKIYY